MGMCVDEGGASQGPRACERGHGGRVGGVGGSARACSGEPAQTGRRRDRPAPPDTCPTPAQFNLPMAWTTAVLAWSVYEFKDGYKAAKQYDAALDNIKWVTDYFIKCVGDGKEIVGQVGNGGQDHGERGVGALGPGAEARGRKGRSVHGSGPRFLCVLAGTGTGAGGRRCPCARAGPVRAHLLPTRPAPTTTALAGVWGRPEDKTAPNPVYTLTADRPGSDVVGAMAAALGAASVVFKDTNPAYSAKLLAAALKAYNFATKHQGLYNNAIPGQPGRAGPGWAGMRRRKGSLHCAAAARRRTPRPCPFPSMPSPCHAAAARRPLAPQTPRTSTAAATCTTTWRGPRCGCTCAPVTRSTRRRPRSCMTSTGRRKTARACGTTLVRGGSTELGGGRRARAAAWQEGVQGGLLARGAGAARGCRTALWRPATVRAGPARGRAPPPAAICPLGALPVSPPPPQTGTPTAGATSCSCPAGSPRTSSSRPAWTRLWTTGSRAASGSSTRPRASRSPATGAACATSATRCS